MKLQDDTGQMDNMTHENKVRFIMALLEHFRNFPAEILKLGRQSNSKRILASIVLFSFASV